MSDLTPIIQESFLQFAGAVLQNRALVDVRDCIKPSARQIFYCMYTDKFIHSKPFQKTLKAIGSAFRLYIHGDSSAEGVIMRAGQPFAMRYPLVEVEGSYGTLLSASSWAAPRYTSARLSPLADYLFSDLGKGTIEEWRDNYDNTEQYPSVLPSKGFFNLVNGSYGIGVGASSSIPQYNLRELNQALETLLLNPNCDFDEIYVAPDFATGATIINGDEVKESHRNGTGKACKIRATVEWDSKDRCLIVTEIPYMLYTETICKELEEIINGENNFGIERFNDLTGQTPLIKIYLYKNSNPTTVLKRLYEKTSLQSYYGINFTMLDNGRFPKVFTWKEMLQAHIDHEKVVYRRSFEFDLAKIERRLHIIDGLLICIANINEVVNTIKNAASSAVASRELMSKFMLDEEQTKAVLDMRLARLANLEVKKLEDEKKELTDEAARITAILNDENLFNQELIKGWREVSQKFGDERRTRIENLTTNGDEVVEVQHLQVMLTNKDNIYATATSSLLTQRKNGVGTKIKLKGNEHVIATQIADNTDTLLVFSKSGKYYPIKASEIAVETLTSLHSIVELDDNDPIINLTCVRAKSSTYIIFITKNGIVKKSLLSDYNTKRAKGTVALKLDDGDEIVSILFTQTDDIGLLSQNGNFLIISSSAINSIGRVARGVVGMKLNSGDIVVAAHLIGKHPKELVSLSRSGMIQRADASEFSVQGRATKGCRLQRLNDGDTMVDFCTIETARELIINSTRATLKCQLSDVQLTSKGCLGTHAIKLGANDKAVSIEV